MPLLDMTNPEVIKFYTENHEKSIHLRQKWNNLHGEKLKKAATLQRKETGYTTNDVIKSTMVAEMEALRRDHITSCYNRRRTPVRDCTQIPGVAHLKKDHSIVDLNLGDPRLDRPDTDTTLDPVMRIVDPEQKNIIYKDVPDFGRAVYLMNRSRTLPEDKYYFPECSSWDYGWRLKDSRLSVNRPSCGRIWRYSRDANSRTGPHPDPAYYKDSDINTVVKCTF